MLKKQSFSEKIGSNLITVFMLVFLVVTLYPLIHVLFASVSEPAELVAHRGLILYPLGFSFEPFEYLFRNQYIISGLINSGLLIIGGVSVNIVMTAIAAYVLSKRYAKLTKFFTMFIIFTMLFSGGLVPLYLTIRGFGMYNSYASLIIPFAINTFNLIILRTAFEGVPASLDESARIDGAGHFTILFKITIPLVMPMIAVIVLYYALDRWNGWFFASIFLKDKELFPIQVILREMLIDGDSGAMMAGNDNADMMMLAQSVRYAGIVIGTLPVLFFYPFLQRYFVKGALSGAVKE